MVCDVTDLKCVFVNEYIGDPILAILVLGVVFFLFTSYNRLGLKTSLWLAIFYFPVITYFISGSIFIIIIEILIVAILYALLFTRLLGNR